MFYNYPSCGIRGYQNKRLNKYVLCTISLLTTSLTEFLKMIKFYSQFLILLNLLRSFFDFNLAMSPLPWLHPLLTSHPVQVLWELKIKTVAPGVPQPRENIH